METCELNPSLQNEKSAELLKIVQEDQADRSGPNDSLDWSKVNPRDLRRRVKVSRIFAEGCFKTVSDYKSAALIFQHGTTADHYFQAFIWSNAAVKLGDDSQRMSVANGVDRYLVKIGHKQLFGTQFSKGPAELSKGAEGRWCIQPVEPSFPESRKFEYLTMNRRDYIVFVLKAIGATQSPEETKDCERPLEASPAGIVPGFW